MCFDVSLSFNSIRIATIVEYNKSVFSLWVSDNDLEHVYKSYWSDECDLIRTVCADLTGTKKYAMLT